MNQKGSGAEGDRTLDLRIANATLSQLSYRPTRRAILASGAAAASVTPCNPDGFAAAGAPPQSEQSDDEPRHARIVPANRPGMLQSRHSYRGHGYGDPVRNAATAASPPRDPRCH